MPWSPKSSPNGKISPNLVTLLPGGGRDLRDGEEVAVEAHEGNPDPDRGVRVHQDHHLPGRCHSKRESLDILLNIYLYHTLIENLAFNFNTRHRLCF